MTRIYQFRFRLHIHPFLTSRAFLLSAAEQRGDTALIVAAGRGHQEIAAALIAAGTDCNVKDNVRCCCQPRRPSAAAQSAASARGHFCPPPPLFYATGKKGSVRA